MLFKTDGLIYLRKDFVFWLDSVKSRKFYWVIITVTLASGCFVMTSGMLPALFYCSVRLRFYFKLSLSSNSLFCAIF